MALFKLVSQIFSWAITILVARILVPGDYGLMELSTIITGYAAIFNELGFGAAIIQRPRVKKNELSSVFWFILGFSLILALSCFPVAYITANIFNEPRVIPITKTVSILFIFSGLQIIPLSLLKKKLEFKLIGLSEMMGVFVSCIGMYIIARLGGGVWTLISGYIIRSLTQLILICYFSKWLPKFHFIYSEASSYLSFGIYVAISSSFNYANSKSDKFFAGRVWNSATLGFYSFALQLAKIPTEKIVTLINQVSYPVFAALQDKKQRFNAYYLNLINITAILVFPLFFGGFLVGDELIKILLNEKWYPIILIFRLLCLSQILTALNAVNNFVHFAQGRPKWGLYINATMAILMGISFFFAVNYGLNATIIPWFTTYAVICIIWILITINKIEVHLFSYLKAIITPLAAVTAMSAVVISLEYLIGILALRNNYDTVILALKLACGGIVYFLVLIGLDKSVLIRLKEIRKS